MKEYMLMRGNITSVTLVLKKATSEKIVKKKLKPSYLDARERLAYWEKIIEIDKYVDELEKLIRSRMTEYVNLKYKGKYEFMCCEDLEFKERNLRMSELPLIDCMDYMTVEQFTSQFKSFRGLHE